VPLDYRQQTPCRHSRPAEFPAGLRSTPEDGEALKAGIRENRKTFFGESCSVRVGDAQIDLTRFRRDTDLRYVTVVAISLESFPATPVTMSFPRFLPFRDHFDHESDE